MAANLEDCDRLTDANVNFNEGNLNYDQDTRNRIQQCTQKYDLKTDADKESDDYKLRHYHDYCELLNMVAMLTGNADNVLAVALCIDHAEIQKNANDLGKEFKFPAYYVNATGTGPMVNADQSLMTRLGAKGYKIYCDLQDAELITYHTALAERGGNVRSMVDAFKRGQQYRYPPWFGEKGLQEDYGIIIRYLKKFWCMNPHLTRVEAYNQGLAKLREWILKDPSTKAYGSKKEGPNRIIKAMVDEKRKEICEKKLLEVVSDLEDQDNEVAGQPAVRVVKDNHKLAEWIVEFFSLWKMKYDKKEPDILLCFQAYLRQEADGTQLAKDKQTFAAFLQIVPKKTTEYLEKVLEIQMKKVAEVAKEEKKVAAQKKKLLMQDNKEKKKRERDAKAAEREEKKQAAKKRKEDKEEEYRQKALQQIAEEEKNKCGRASGERPKLNLGVFPHPQRTDKDHLPPVPVLNDDNFCALNKEGYYDLSEPGKEWILSMNNWYLRVNVLVEAMLIKKGLSVKDFRDSDVPEEMTKEASLVVMAIMFMMDEQFKDDDGFYTPWLDGFTTPWLDGTGIGVAIPLFHAYVQDMQWLWMPKHAIERTQETFHTFFTLLTAPGYTDGEREVLQNQMVEFTNDPESMPAGNGNYMRGLMLYVLKINQFFEGNVTTWFEANGVSYPDCMNGYTAAAPAAAANGHADGGSEHDDD